MLISVCSTKFPILLALTKMYKIKIVVGFVTILVFKKNSKWEIVPYIPFKFPKFLLKIFIKIFIKLIASLSNKIIVLTNESKLGLVEYYGVENKKIEVIHLGVSEKIKELNQEKHKKFEKLFEGKKIILCFGVISPRKGQESAVKAFKKIAQKLPNHVLVITGKSPPYFRSYEKNLHELSQSLKNQIVFTGFVDDDEVQVLFEMCEMALYLYQPMSGSTYALTFAIQHRKPVIVTNLDIFYEMLGKEQAEFVETDNDDQLTNAILKLSNNENLRIEFSEKMDKVAKKFSWEKMASKHIKVYEKIIEE